MQIHQPVQQVDPRDLDSLLPFGIGDYTYVQQPARSSAPPTPSSSQSLPLPTPSGSGPMTATTTMQKVVLGRGKFSQVLLARKDGVEVGHAHEKTEQHFRKLMLYLANTSTRSNIPRYTCTTTSSRLDSCASQNFFQSFLRIPT